MKQVNDQAENGAPGKRQIMIMISTLVILGSGFAYYFFGYVKVKEANLNEMGFRVLSRLGTNIVSKKENFVKNGKNIIRVELKKNPKISVDSINSIIQHKEVNKDIHFTQLMEEQNVNYPMIKGRPGFLQVSDTVGTGQIKTAYSFSLDLQDLVPPLIRKDLFDEYILFNGDTTLFSSIKSGFELKSVDSLLDETLGMQLSSIKELEIGGIEYQFFLQPHQVDINNTWIIGGLIRNGKYNSARMGVSPVIIMFVFLFTLLTILSIPFLKLKLMSSLERLNLSDAVFAVFSLVIGSSIVVILMLHTYRMGGPDAAVQFKEIEDFAINIGDEFYKEIDASYKQLKAFDAIYNDKDVDGVTKISQSNPTAWHENATIDINANHYPLFGQIFWADEKGMQHSKWTTGSNTTNKIDVSGRHYFKDNLSNQAWKVDGKEFAVESIYSWNTGKTMVGMGTTSSVENAKYPVVALSSQFYSVIDPIIPLGHVFAIVDERGRVLFHSDKERNLQENFIEESENNPRLRSAIYAHTGTHLELKYHGVNYDGYLNPLRDIPLYVVALREQDYDRTTRAQTLNFTMLHIVFFFLFFVAMALLSRFLGSSQTRLKKKELLFGWIWPTEINKMVYQRIVIINVTIAVLLLVLTSISSAAESVTLLYVASIYCFIITFFLLNFKKVGKDFFKKHLLFSIFILSVLAAITIYSLSNDYWMILLFQLVIIVIIIVPKGRLLAPMADARTNYSQMILSWILITSIIPAILFYRISYNVEHELAVKHNQLDMAKQLADRTAQWDNSRRTDYLSSDPNDLSNRGDIYSKHLFDSIYFRPQMEKEIQSDVAESTFYTLLSSFVRPFYNEIVVQNNDLVFNKTKNTEWYWTKSTNLQLVFSNFQLQDTYKNKELVLTSKIPTFHMPTIIGKAPRNALFAGTRINPMDVLFWLLLTFIVGGLYALIRYTVRNIFVQNIFTPGYFEIDEKLFRRDEEHKNVFLIGLPKCGKSQFLSSKFPDDERKLSINLIQVFYDKSWDDTLKKALNPTIDLVVVDHFEYNLENKELTQKKLELLEQLMLFREKKIIVATSVHLTNIEELYTDDGEISESDQEAIYRWTELFKNFYEVYFPLQGFNRVNPPPHSFPNQPESINYLLANEFNHGLYLAELRPEIEKLVENNEVQEISSDYDQIVMKIQSLCAVYYHSLWATCTESEKYIIYDLAEDGLVNAKNFQTIEILLNKGLVTYTGSLHVMNESFRNFVLTKIGPADAIRMEQKASAGGTWTSIRNPLIIVLLGVAGFLIITQQDSISSVISFLAPFIAIVPAAFRIIGIMNRKRAKGGVGGMGFDDD